MADLPLTSTVLALVCVAAGLALAAWAVRALSRRRADSSAGTLIAIDAGRPAVLRSERFRIRGRPDGLRRTRDGRLVPVELKSRASPPNGPTRSHVVQVWAYCLLVEEATGRAPPFGLLRYADHDYRVRWDAAAREELLALRSELGRPYDGRATPSPARCARCAWVRSCDARAVPGLG